MSKGLEKSREVKHMEGMGASGKKRHQCSGFSDLKQKYTFVRENIENNTTQ